MNEFKSAKAGQYAGIVYIVIAVLSLLGMITNPYSRSLWTFLEILASGYLAALLLLKRRDFLVAIGFGVLAILALRGLFLYVGFISKLSYLLQVLAYVSMTLFSLTDFIPSLKDAAKRYWFAPAGCMVLCVVPLFLSGVFHWIFDGWPFFAYFIMTVLTGIISYAIYAAGLYFAASWMQGADELPLGGAAPRARQSYQQGAYQQTAYQQGAYQSAPEQGPRVSSAGASYAEGAVMPASAYCGLVKHILLLLFTFGIWYLIWIYRTTDNLNCLSDEPPRNPATKLLLCMFVPFYSIYWVYKSAQRIDRLSAMAGRPSDSATLCLILAIVIGIVPPILMQDKINSLAAPQGAPYGAAPQQPQAQPRVQQQPQGSYSAPQQPRYAAPQQPAPQAGVVDAAGELKKYKELLDMGAITQEEYDAKKKQLLGL